MFQAASLKNETNRPKSASRSSCRHFRQLRQKNDEFDDFLPKKFRGSSEGVPPEFRRSSAGVPPEFRRSSEGIPGIVGKGGGVLEKTKMCRSSQFTSAAPSTAAK